MKIMLLGLGNMGRNHARTLRSLGHEVVSVDPNPDSGATLREPPDEAMDAVCVATPAETLAGAVAETASPGVPIMIEKPMGTSLADAEAIAGSVAGNGTFVGVGFTEVFNPAVEVLAENLERVGTLRHIAIQRLGPEPGRETLSPAKDLATHDIAVLRRLGFEPTVEHASQHDGHLIATLRLTDSTTAAIEASHLHPVKIRTLNAVGDDGMLTLDYQEQSVTFHYTAGSVPIPVAEEEPLRVQWQRFFEGRGFDAADALEVMRVAEEMERLSAR